MAETSKQTNPEGPEQHPNQSVLNEAQELLVQGKRFMALGDYQSATDSLEQAVQLFDAYYGVAKIQCADAYLEYGVALVALANLEAGSGADKIMKKAGIENGDEEEEEDDDDDDDDGDENGEDEDGEGSEETSDDGQAKKENGTKVEENGKATNGQHESMEVSSEKPHSEKATTATSEAQASSSSSVEPTPGTSSGSVVGEGGDKDVDDEEEEEEEEEQEATTIEIAWEVLCLAKRLFMTDESLTGRLKLAETYQKLGEISIEWENNDNAVDILQECLNIRKAILPPEDRLIALTYYHLGLAHSFKSETDNANLNFQNAIDVIEKRIEILSKELDTAKGSQDTQKVSSCEKEINELKELLPDMTMRMDDSKEDGVETTQVLKRTREEMKEEDDEMKKVCSDKSKPVDDISHLVKRKAT